MSNKLSLSSFALLLLHISLSVWYFIYEGDIEMSGKIVGGHRNLTGLAHNRGCMKWKQMKSPCKTGASSHSIPRSAQADI